MRIFALMKSLKPKSKGLDKSCMQAPAVTGGYIVAIVLIFVCYAAMYYFTPVYGDDLCFFKDYIQQTGLDHLTPGGISRFFVFLWHTENGRLPNLLLMGIYAMALNKLSAAILMGALATGMTHLLTRAALRITEIGIADVFHIAVVWILSTLGLSWWSNMFTGALATNYILPTLMDVWLILLIVDSFCRRYSHLQCVLLMVYAVLCGWMHEGASAVVLGGIGVWILAKRFRMPAIVWGILVAFGVGFALTLSSPMIWVRFALEHQQLGASDVATSPLSASVAAPVLELTANPTPLVWRVVQLVAEMIPLPAALVILLVLLCLWRKGRRVLSALAKSDLAIICSAAMLVGLCMWTVLARHNAGVTWFPQCFALILLSSIIFRLVAGWRRCRNFVAILLLTGTTAGFGRAVAATADINKEYDAIVAKAQSSPSGTVFYDFPERPYFSALRLPPSQIWRCDMHIFAINYYRNKVINVVPAALRGFSAEKARPLDGNAGVLEFEGLLVAPDENLVYERFDMPCEVPSDYADYVFAAKGVKSGYPILVKRYKFVAADSGRWLYLEPTSAVDARLLGTADRR